MSRFRQIIVPAGWSAVFAAIAALHVQFAASRMSEIRRLAEGSELESAVSTSTEAAAASSPAAPSDVSLQELAELLRQTVTGEPTWNIEVSGLQAGLDLTQVSVRFQSDFEGVIAFLRSTCELPGPVRTEHISIRRRERDTPREPLLVHIKLIAVSAAGERR